MADLNSRQRRRVTEQLEEALAGHGYRFGYEYELLRSWDPDLMVIADGVVVKVCVDRTVHVGDRVFEGEGFKGRGFIGRMIDAVIKTLTEGSVDTSTEPIATEETSDKPVAPPPPTSAAPIRDQHPPVRPPKRFGDQDGRPLESR